MMRRPGIFRREFRVAIFPAAAREAGNLPEQEQGVETAWRRTPGRRLLSRRRPAMAMFGCVRQRNERAVNRIEKLKSSGRLRYEFRAENTVSL
jgi:hypothetical protein